MLVLQVVRERVSFLAKACAAVVVASITGCSSLPTQTVAPPDTAAVGTIVEAACAQLGQPEAVFLGAEGIEDVTMARIRSELSDGLSVTFYAPSDRASGEVGASIALGRFQLAGDGHLSVAVSFVQADGSARGCAQYTLEQDGEKWGIADEVDAWPDCLLSSQGDETYHASVERARSNECFGLWTSVGICGPWLYVAATSGYTGTRSYFDPQTGLLAAQERFSDADEVSDLFVFGHVDCEPSVTETILCDR